LDCSGFTMANDYQGGNRRREIRYPLEAKVTVRTKNGEAIHATALDISSSGMRLCFAELCPLARGEEITVEVELPECSDKSFSAWGVGRIAYVEGRGAGIQLLGGQFDGVGPGEVE
jgi:c-di-GMP-binding flagellar brake protein YcgR